MKSYKNKKNKTVSGKSKPLGLHAYFCVFGRIVRVHSPGMIKQFNQKKEKKKSKAYILYTGGKTVFQKEKKNKTLS